MQKLTDQTTPKRKPSKAKERRVRREGAAAQFARVKVPRITPQFVGECQDFQAGATAYLDGWSIEQCRSQWQRVGWVSSREIWRGFMQNK